MFDPFGIVATKTKRDRLSHVMNDRANAIGNSAVWRVQPNSHVAASDVESDAGDADLSLVGDDAANGLRIAKMTVSANHAADHIADRHAITHLRNRRLVVLSEHLESAVLELRLLWLHCRNAGCCHSS